MKKTIYPIRSEKTLLKKQSTISVFLVDDDKVYLATLEYYLNKQLESKIQIESFTNGEDCLYEVERNPTIEVVILDYYLNTESSNKMSGLNVLNKIKEINSDIIVIMLSGEDKLAVAIDCITYGAYEFVVKSETAFIRTQNILKNIIHSIELQSYYPPDIGGEA